MSVAGEVILVPFKPGDLRGEQVEKKEDEQCIMVNENMNNQPINSIHLETLNSGSDSEVNAVRFVCVEESAPNQDVLCVSAFNLALPAKCRSDISD